MTEHNDNPITQPEQPASPQAPAQQQAYHLSLFAPAMTFCEGWP